MTKYQKIFQEMADAHSDLFNRFREIHDKYALDPAKWQTDFNLVGAQVLDVIRKYENRLCGKSEGGGYGKFSSGLSDKFWAMIRMVFPKIDFIGVK